MWRTYEDLHAFTYRQAAHAGFLRRRAEWFLPPEPPATALWWMPSGRRPSLSGALRRLAVLRVDGPTPRVFSPRHRFTPDGLPVPRGHPHTSVTKAALNMLTRAGADDLAADGVHMCAVDTGWVSDERPAPQRAVRAREGWRPPLDVVDAAARIYDPVLRGEAGDPVRGVLLRHYRPVPW